MKTFLFVISFILFLFSVFLLSWFSIFIVKFWRKNGKFNFEILIKRFGCLRLFFLYLLFIFAWGFFVSGVVNYFNLYRLFPGFSFKRIVYLLFGPLIFYIFYFRDNFTILFLSKLFKRFGKIWGSILLFILTVAAGLFLFLIVFFCRNVLCLR